MDQTNLLIINVKSYAISRLNRLNNQNQPLNKTVVAGIKREAQINHH